MYSWKTALAALLFCGTSLAAPYLETTPKHLVAPRDDFNSSSDDPSVLLEPVIPDGVNPGSLTNLALNKQITLAWAGTASGATSKRRVRKRDGAVYSEAAFTFKYPTIPLDHSSFVSGVSCSGNTLTGTLSSSAYTYAKARWATAGNIVFVTSVDGCGNDDENQLFLATSVTFPTGGKTFKAVGSVSSYKGVGTKMSLQWGDIGTKKIKRAIDKAEMFEPHPLHRRLRESIDFDWSLTLDQYYPADPNAPWDDARIIAQWSKTGGKPDSSYQKGEIKGCSDHKKREVEEVSLTPLNPLAVRESTTNNTVKCPKKNAGKVEGGLTYGFGLYCVDCGFSGGTEFWGEVDADILLFSITKAQVGLNAHFGFDANIGLAAYVIYEKSYTKDIAKVPIYGFEIPLIADIGAFVTLAIQVSASIGATGTLLVGVGRHWDDIEFVLDLLDSDGTKATGLDKRTDSKRFQAAGELKIEVSVGLPVSIGIEVNILSGLFKAESAIVDTPSIVAEGVFEVSATKNAEGDIITDVNGDCYGIAVSIYLKNTLQWVSEITGLGKEVINLLRPMQSDPIYEHCLSFVKDSDGASGGSGGSGSKGSQGGSATVSAPPVTTTLANGCIPNKIIYNNTVPAGVSCKITVNSASISKSYEVEDNMSFTTADKCGEVCYKNKNCAAFGYSTRLSCQMYKASYKKLPIQIKGGTPDQTTYYDRGCYQPQVCKKPK